MECEKCVQDMPVTMPIVVHEAIVEREQKHARRWFVAWLITFICLVACFIGFSIYESQFATVVYDQGGDGLNNINQGEQGDIDYEPKVED